MSRREYASVPQFMDYQTGTKIRLAPKCVSPPGDPLFAWPAPRAPYRGCPRFSADWQPPSVVGEGARRVWQAFAYQSGSTMSVQLRRSSRLGNHRPTLLWTRELDCLRLLFLGGAAPLLCLSEFRGLRWLARPIGPFGPDLRPPWQPRCLQWHDVTRPGAPELGRDLTRVAEDLSRRAILRQRHAEQDAHGAFFD
jgi:hypothetical protein